MKIMWVAVVQILHSAYGLDMKEAKAVECLFIAMLTQGFFLLWEWQIYRFLCK